MNTWFCICLLFNQVIFTIQSRPDTFINSYFRFILESQLRREMAVGIPSLGLPPLDPLYIYKIPINWGDKNNNHITGSVFNTKLNGLSSFNLTQFQADLHSLTLNFEMHFSNLLARGQYDLKGKLWNVFNIKGAGNFTITGTDVLIEAYANFTFNKEVQVNHLHLDSNFRVVSAHFPNLLGRGIFHNLFNAFVTHFGQFTFNLFKPTLMDRAGHILKQHINAKMRKIKVNDFILIMNL